MKTKIQSHKSKADRRVPRRKTAAVFQLHKIRRISFQNPHKRISTVINIELIRTVNIGKIFGARHNQRHQNQTQQQNPHGPIMPPQGFNPPGQQQINHCRKTNRAVEKLRPLIKKPGQLLVQQRIHHPLAAFGNIKQILNPKVNIGIIFQNQNGGQCQKTNKKLLRQPVHKTPQSLLKSPPA